MLIGIRKYYRTILNTTSEIIVVIDRNKIVDANNLFYEFYSSTKSLQSFNQKYQSISHTFEPGEGFLQPEMNGQNWMDYILKHPDIEHIAKIKKGMMSHYFHVKMAEFTISGESLYSIIMHDVTKQIGYKRRLEQQAETDPLTGIANRLVFNKRLSDENSRANRYKGDLCLAVFDMDNFKNINDQHGHDTGDKALNIVSSEVAILLRETDVFCRIGGEEFAVIMPETHLEDACKVAERIRQTVETCSQKVIESGFTVSIGIGYMGRGDNDRSLFRKADKALYRAKQKGRNRTEVADEA